MKKFLTFFLFGVALSQVLKVVTLEWKPFDFVEVIDGKKVYRGIDLELTLETLKRMGYEAVVELYPWGRCLRMMELKKADVIVSAYYKKDRERYLIYPDEPLNYSLFAIFFLREKNFKTFEDIVGKTLAYVEAYYYGPDFERLPVRKIPVGSSRTEFEMLKAGRVDMVIEDYFVGMEMIREMGMEGEVEAMFLPEFLRPIASYAAFAKKPGYEELAEEFSKVLKEVKRDLQRKLIEKYVGSADEYWRIINSFKERVEKP